MKEFKFELVNVHPHVVGTIGWINYQYRIDAVVKGRPLHSVGTVTMVLRRQNGKWLIVHYHISSKRPEARTAAAPKR
jgi:ketosteroid isomerase-like protein